MFIELTDSVGKIIVNTDVISYIWEDTKCPVDSYRTGIAFTDNRSCRYVKESYEEIRKTLNVHGILR